MAGTVAIFLSVRAAESTPLWAYRVDPVRVPPSPNVSLGLWSLVFIVSQ